MTDEVYLLQINNTHQEDIIERVNIKPTVVLETLFPMVAIHLLQTHQAMEVDQAVALHHHTTIFLPAILLIHLLIHLTLQLPGITNNITINTSNSTLPIIILHSNTDSHTIHQTAVLPTEHPTATTIPKNKAKLIDDR